MPLRYQRCWETKSGYPRKVGNSTTYHQTAIPLSSSLDSTVLFRLCKLTHSTTNECHHKSLVTINKTETFQCTKWNQKANGNVKRTKQHKNKPVRICTSKSTTLQCIYQICVLPDPGAPQNSVIFPSATPPPSNVSSCSENVTIGSCLWTVRRRSNAVTVDDWQRSLFESRVTRRSNSTASCASIPSSVSIHDTRCTHNQSAKTRPLRLPSLKHHISKLSLVPRWDFLQTNLFSVDVTSQAAPCSVCHSLYTAESKCLQDVCD